MSSTASRIGAFLLGLLVVAFGFLCLNFTQGFGMAHHAEWANSHGMPPPSYPIFLTGAVTEALGALIVGVALGRRSRAAA
jgi:uncharacterized membrane protein YphA (DoxX/SURF4 family)